MPILNTQEWLRQRLDELLPDVDLLSYEQLEEGGEHVVMLYDRLRGVGLVIAVPDEYVRAHRRGDEERLEKLLKFAGKELKTVAAQPLSAD
ncbi:MAG TPA: hypothetical protein VNN18_05135 [Candidatus Xenobia bacterium]|nr:hypothetical protein [Candidatus Xenobia bacterium]